LEVLILSAEGLTAREVADRFGTSPDTVRTQRERLITKLGARNMAHAVALAFASGEIALASTSSNVVTTPDYPAEPEPATL
jgi:DNA-binding CsgD family transcriptional regulator